MIQLLLGTVLLASEPVAAQLQAAPDPQASNKWIVVIDGKKVSPSPSGITSVSLEGGGVFTFRVTKPEPGLGVPPAAETLFRRPAGDRVSPRFY